MVKKWLHFSTHWYATIHATEETQQCTISTLRKKERLQKVIEKETMVWSFPFSLVVGRMYIRAVLCIEAKALTIVQHELLLQFFHNHMPHNY